MNTIKRLEQEHDEILKFLNHFEMTLIKLMEENIFNLNVMQEAIDFIKSFADKRHHTREEKILFSYMEKHLGIQAQNLIRNGMLVEHDLARFYVKKLSELILDYDKEKTPSLKLSIIGYGYSYIELLRRHIDKENNVVYPFAKRMLDENIWPELEALEETYFNNLN